MPARGSATRALRDWTGEAAYWDITDIQFHCRISRSTAWRLVRDDSFPHPVVLGTRSLLWPRCEVHEFMEARRDPEHYRAHTSLEPGVESAGFSERALRQRRIR